MRSCYNCTERREGCHSICEKYISEKDEYEKRKAKIKRAKAQENIADSQAIASVEARKKRYAK